MNLLERYLQAVKFFLPRKQRDDIIRELEDNLVAEMDDRSEVLGRPLSEDEQAEILRRNGHPMIAAGHYQSPRQLIGPAFFSLYLFVLRMGLAAALAVGVAIAIVGGALHGGFASRLVDELLAVPGRALAVFAWTTLGFAALDLAQTRFTAPGRWDPRRLPAVVAPERRLSRANALAEALFMAAAVVWLLFVPRMPFLALGPAATFLQPMPIWSVVYWPIVLLTGLSAALSLLDFFRPYRSQGRSLGRVALGVGEVAVLIPLIGAGKWVFAATGVSSPSGATLERISDVFNMGCAMALSIACVMAAVKIIFEVRHLAIARRGPAEADSAASAAR